jgi:hypothetical protein
MSHATLAELIAQAEAEDNPQAVAVVVEEEEAEEVEEVESEDESEDQTEGESEDKIEDWAKPEGAVPVKTHVEMKHKLKGKLHDAESENAELRARLAALENGNPVVKTQSEPELKRPKLSDADIAFDEDVYADRMAQYTEAIIDRKLSSRDQKQTAQVQQSQHESKVQGEVDKHYERAAELVSSGKITAENYQAADHNVRKAMAQALPGMGEVVLDNLIARLKNGSEKVVYHLGVNPAALSELVNSFKEDSTGFAAASYLGELKAKFNSAPTNKLSQAPKPDKALSGAVSVTSDNFKKAHDKAEKAGDISGMLAAKRGAKAKGINTSNW